MSLLLLRLLLLGWCAAAAAATTTTGAADNIATVLFCCRRCFCRSCVILLLWLFPLPLLLLAPLVLRTMLAGAA